MKKSMHVEDKPLKIPDLLAQFLINELADGLMIFGVQLLALWFSN